MDKYRKDFYRCACCDMKFGSSAECHQHFLSRQHQEVAAMAWIRFVARMNQGIYRDEREERGEL